MESRHIDTCIGRNHDGIPTKMSVHHANLRKRQAHDLNPDTAGVECLIFPWCETPRLYW
jgi:hypothetical protein